MAEISLRVLTSKILLSVAYPDTSGEVNRCEGAIKQDLYSTGESTTSFFVPGVPGSREKSFS